MFKVFIRTIIVTLILSFGYMFWVNSTDSDMKKLESKKITKDTVLPKGSDIEVKSNSPYVQPKEEKKEIKLCFINSKGDYKFSVRESDNTSLEYIIKSLLLGTNEKENSKGYYTEIPAGVSLYWVKVTKNKIIVNLSPNFAQDGGTQSILARINQLSKTIKANRQELPVYLYINGKQAEYIGGDGVYLEQPLN